MVSETSRAGCTPAQWRRPVRIVPLVHKPAPTDQGFPPSCSPWMHAHIVTRPNAAWLCARLPTTGLRDMRVEARGGPSQAPNEDAQPSNRRPGGAVSTSRRRAASDATRAESGRRAASIGRQSGDRGHVRAEPSVDLPSPRTDGPGIGGTVDRRAAARLAGGRRDPPGVRCRAGFPALPGSSPRIQPAVRFLTPREAATFLGLSVRTLARYRCKGIGLLLLLLVAAYEVALQLLQDLKIHLGHKA